MQRQRTPLEARPISHFLGLIICCNQSNIVLSNQTFAVFGYTLFANAFLDLRSFCYPACFCAFSFLFLDFWWQNQWFFNLQHFMEVWLSSFPWYQRNVANSFQSHWPFLSPILAKVQYQQQPLGLDGRRDYLLCFSFGL